MLRCLLVLLCLFLPGLMPAQSLSPTANQAAPQPQAGTTITQGYLYLEPNQMRFEVLFDAATVLTWARLSVPTTLDAAAQKKLTEALAAKAADWCRAGAGTAAEGRFLGASIIKGKPGATLPFEEGAPIAVGEAVAGLIWEFPLPPQPEKVVLEWTGYIQGQKRLPIRLFYGVKSEVLEAKEGTKQVQWQALGRLPTPAPLAVVPKIEFQPPWGMIVGGISWIAGTLVLLMLMKGRWLSWTGKPFSNWQVMAMVLISTMCCWPLVGGRASGWPKVPGKTEGEAILTPLLRNVYRAFDHRAESDIYDTLARSVDGELLRRLYLETLQALTLEGREGTRVTITEFSAEVMDVQRNPAGPGFVTDCQWTALGTVGHWGHAHTRVNRYTAQVTVAPVKQEWKIVKLEVREARRI